MISENTLQKHTYLLFAITTIVILAGIGLRDPWPPDEPRFALMAKEMWDTGNWFFPHRGGEIYPDKPPLVMWMILLFYGLIGNLKIAFLLPSAIFSMGTMWLTYDIAKRMWNSKIGLYAGFLLAITLHFILQAKSGQLDAPVAFWVMLGSYGLLRHMILGPSWKWYYLAFFAMGMGVITKGVGFLPVLMLFALIIVAPKWYDKGDKQLLKWFAGIFFLLLAVSLWLVPMLLQVANNPVADVVAYRDNILLKQTVNRYASSWGHIKPFYYYVFEVIPLFWLPLSLLLPWLFKPFKQAFAQKDRRIIYPLVMVLFVLLFFSLSKGKRAEYMLPILPLLVLVIAPYFELLLNKKGVQRLLFALVLILSVLFVMVGLAGIFEVEKVSSLTAKYFVNPWYWMTSVGVFGLLVIAVLRKHSVKLYAVFVSSLWLSYGLWAAPLVDKAMSTEPMMAAITKVIPQDAELGLVGMREKLLLHTRWQTTHFGYHHPKTEQQQVAINWIMQKPSRYLLINYRYLNDCFMVENSIDYDSFHKSKWLLFSIESLAKSRCSPDNGEYAQFLPKFNEDL
ncbi:MAG: glycosyltransferase family 39 protein [Proteobacteria bacterium]|nr:glycosyltransferase family 39 protein [Pseudomonadota bacterium]